MNLRRLIVGLYLLLFVGIGLASAAFFLQTRAEYNRLRQFEAVGQRRLAEAETRLREQERILLRLQTDPAYVEKIIRRRLGYAKPEEFIFRFEE
ncbi:MAG: septum formation initiator family protein [Opitutaceae bacterium]|nr:septum formation initiator family protein [Opitutaceae bacterium]